MSLPFNSYNQLRYRGNEYVTDQTLNRTVYRLFQNDVYLDNKLLEHVSDNSVHYAESENTLIDYLTSDKLVILPGKGNTNDGYTQTEDIIDNPNLQTYSEKSWQRLIDEQPKNLGGNTLTFRFQQSANQGSNPETVIPVKIIDMLKFSGFYGGNLIIESPAAYIETGSNKQNSSSAANQRLVIKSNGNSNAVISIENCHCKVTVRNSCFMLSDITSITKANDIGTNDFDTKLDSETFENGNIYCNYPDNDGKYECKRYSAVHNKWYDLNMMAAIRIVNTSDVEIRHCCIKF